MSDFEKSVLSACAPTLFGAKQATLFSCPLKNAADFACFRMIYGDFMKEKDIYFKPLYMCKNRLFIMAYRREGMRSYLSQKSVSAFLLKEGYPDLLKGNVEKMLNHLTVRIKLSRSFPHEIGFFLGYPTEDVFGFIKHKGDNYKLCGYWKVYGSEETARDMFSKISESRKMIQHFISSEASIKTLFDAA